MKYRYQTDIISITIVITVAIYHLLSYVMRNRQEVNKSDLYFSLFLIGLAVYIFFGNTIAGQVIKVRNIAQITTSGVLTASAILLIFLGHFLYEILQVSRQKKIFLYISIIISCATLPLQIFVWVKGYLWYYKYLHLLVTLIYLGLYFINTGLLIVDGVKTGRLKEKINVFIFIATQVLIISLFYYQIIFSYSIKYYLLNNFVIVIFTVLFFPVLLVSKSSKEFKENIILKEKLKNLEVDAKQNQKNRKNERVNDFINENKLNEKEILVMKELLNGREYKEIAADIGLSLSGVKKRVHSLYKKTGVQNRVELVNNVLKI
jgi:DNA-binding CsgD family transcriptional regulator